MKKGIFKRALKYIIKGISPIYVNVYNTNPNNCLANQNIFITGGSKGLGYAIAERCIAEGANVIIAGRNIDDLKEASKKLGKKSDYLELDVSNVDNFNDIFEKLEKKFNGKVDALVSNAGISLHEGEFRNVTHEGWDAQFNTNLKGNYFLVQEYIKYLESKKDKKGNILIITSERAKRDDDIPYGLTKIATSSFIRTMAERVVSEGIRINGVGPGVTASDMTGFKKNDDLYCEYQPTKRVFLPEEVAEVCNFLLSDVSNCITGEIITCNLGRHINHW